MKNVVPPAEGNLYLASIWPVGTRLGLVALYYLGPGVPMGMRILTLFFVLTLTAFTLYRGTCICVTITAPVTFTNNWIKFLFFPFQKLENGLLKLFGGSGQQGLQWCCGQWAGDCAAVRHWPGGMYVILPLEFVSNMYKCATFMYSCPCSLLTGMYRFGTQQCPYHMVNLVVIQFEFTHVQVCYICQV